MGWAIFETKSGKRLMGLIEKNEYSSAAGVEVGLASCVLLVVLVLACFMMSCGVSCHCFLCGVCPAVMSLPHNSLLVVR
jgi:hypothetical protein